jgi:hypothetical protein
VEERSDFHRLALTAGSEVGGSRYALPPHKQEKVFASFFKKKRFIKLA